MLNIESPDIEMTEGLQSQCDKAYSKLSSRHPPVSVSLHINQEGKGFRACWNYVVPKRPPVVVKDTGDDLYSLIKATSESVSRVLSDS